MFKLYKLGKKFDLVDSVVTLTEMQKCIIMLLKGKEFCLSPKRIFGLLLGVAHAKDTIQKNPPEVHQNK